MKKLLCKRTGNALVATGMLLSSMLMLSCSDTLEPVLPAQPQTDETMTRAASSLQPLNDVMMQAFYWNVPVDETNKNDSWWNTLRSKASEMKSSGITAIWTPVPSKGNWGIVDNGYGIYDHYDLGNYDQKGTVETRYGSRAELEQMIGARKPLTRKHWKSLSNG